MKKVAIFIFILFISGISSLLLSQPKRNLGVLSLKIGTIPFNMDETKIDALTNDKADKSPVIYIYI